MKSFFKYLAVLLSGYLILILSVFALIGLFAETEPVIYDNSYLEMTIGGQLPEYVAPSYFDEITGGTVLDLKKIRENLEKAAVDDRINGVILKLGFLRSGYAKIEELQNLIDTYRQSGKKIYAYLEFGLTKDYLVAIACDSVFIPPSSNLFINGIGSELVFYKDFFNKIGIQADFVHVGEYKNAPDQYTKSNISPEQSQEINNILDQFYTFIVSSISNRRNIPEDQVKNLIDNTTGFTTKQAIELGLIDGNLYLENIIGLLSRGADQPNMVNGSTYAVIPISSLSIRDESRIAVVHISGTITSGNDVDDPIMGKLAGANTIIKNINRAAESSSTKAIILRIDSPGGSAIASDLIWKAVMDARNKKPVIASVSDYGASGGYYIAMAADTIISSPMSVVGSIGIFAGKFSIGGLYEKLGINSARILRGKNAALFSPTSLWSDSERAMMQRLIQDFYVDFVTKVSENRSMTYDAVDDIARGRVWSGQESMQNGLSDSTGSFYTAIQTAQKMAGISKNESVRLSYYPGERDFFTELYSLISLNFNKFKIFSEPENTYLMQLQNHPLALMTFLIEWI